MRSRARTVGVFVIFAVAAIGLTALGFTLGLQTSGNVGGRGGSISVAESPSAVQDGAVPELSGNGTSATGTGTDSAKTTSPVDSLVIRTAAMDLRVEDVDSALTSLRTAVSGASGEISDLIATAGDQGPVVPLDGVEGSVVSGPASAVVTIRVPAENLTELERAVAELGTVLRQSSSASDVTEQAIDLEARLKNLRAEESRLRSFLLRTNRVSDLLAVERELARVRGEIEAMDAQLTYLKRQAARSTLTVTLTEPGPVVQPSGTTWGIREAFTRGIQLAAGVVTTLITVSIPLALIAALGLLVLLPIRAIIRRRPLQTGDRGADAEQHEPE